MLEMKTVKQQVSEDGKSASDMREYGKSGVSG